MAVKYIKIVLFLVGLHSIAVGINLIAFPPAWMEEFGFSNISNNFFKVQGGVFHIVMAVAYLLAARNPVDYRIMVVFSITAKGIATVFLVTYYLFVQDTVMILLSGIVDFLMGVFLLLIYRNTNLSKEVV